MSLKTDAGAEVKERSKIANENMHNCFLCEEKREIFGIIASKVEEPVEESDINSCLSDLGVNSITFILIVVELENAYEIEFNEDILVLGNTNTIRALIDYVFTEISA